MKKDIITLNNISKKFGSFELFSNFSFSIQEQVIQAIIGPNGAGKTSLLRILTGLYQVDSGEVKVLGSHSTLLENDYLYEDKTGLENMKIFGLYFGYKLEDYQKFADSLGLSQHLNKQVSTYSKGLKRKLSLLIIILMGKEIVFLDEVTSGVDPISRVEIRNIIREMKNNGKTIVITSHDLSEVEKIADSVLMVDNGRIVLNLVKEDLEGNSLENMFIEVGGK